MSVSQILDSNGKIPASLIEGGGGSGSVPPLVSVLQVGSDAMGNAINDVQLFNSIVFDSLSFQDGLNNIYFSMVPGQTSMSLTTEGDVITQPTIKLYAGSADFSSSVRVGVNTTGGASSLTIDGGLNLNVDGIDNTTNMNLEVFNSGTVIMSGITISSSSLLGRGSNISDIRFVSNSTGYLDLYANNIYAFNGLVGASLTSTENGIYIYDSPENPTTTIRATVSNIPSNTFKIGSGFLGDGPANLQVYNVSCTNINGAAYPPAGPALSLFDVLSNGADTSGISINSDVPLYTTEIQTDKMAALGIGNFIDVEDDLRFTAGARIDFSGNVDILKSGVSVISTNISDDLVLVPPSGVLDSSGSSFYARFGSFSNGTNNILLDPDTVNGVECQDNSGNGVIKIVGTSGSYSQLTRKQIDLFHTGLTQSDPYLTLNDTVSTANLYLGNTAPIHSAPNGSLFIQQNSTTPALYIRNASSWLNVGPQYSLPQQRVISIGKDANQNLVSPGTTQISWDALQFEKNNSAVLRWPSPFPAPNNGSAYIGLDNSGGGPNQYLINASLCFQYTSSGETNGTYALVARVFDSTGATLQEYESNSVVHQPSGSTNTYFTVNLSCYFTLSGTNAAVSFYAKTTSPSCVLLGTAAYDGMTYAQISCVS